MLLSEKHIKQFACFYLLCFLINYGWFWFNGLLFSSVNPVFFLNRLDLTRNIFMLGNLQHFIINYQWLRICLDVTYLVLPVILTVTVLVNFKGNAIIAFCTIAFTLVYAIFFSAFTYISIEGYISWILVPLILSARTTKGFYYYLHAIRILFVLFFVSAAIAKIRSGVIFNTEQMAAILLKQHNIYLVSNSDDWFTKSINFIVEHKAIGYIFFVCGTLAELLFATCFFTRRFDGYLIWVFCIFLAGDLFLMRINYFTWMVFMACFYYSSFSLQEERQ